MDLLVWILAWLVQMDSILNYDSVGKVIFLFVPILIYYIWFGREKFKTKFNSLFSETNEHLQITTNLFILIEIAVWAVIVLAFWDIFLVHQKITDFGQWGDFFGGVLNPILTFLTFVGLMITIILQQIELKESRVEFSRTADALNKQEEHMKIQTFENTFFKMLELHNNIVENLKFEYHVPISQYNYVERDEKATGREVFELVFNFLYSNSGNPILPLRPYISKIQNKNNHILGQYFRNLYQILKFIKKQESLLDENLQNYANILRAQLTSYELIFLFLNCFDGVSDEGQFQELLIEYSVLQHFPINKIEKIDTMINMREYYAHIDGRYDKDYAIKLFLSNGKELLLGKKALSQFYKKDKSAFDGNNIMFEKRVFA